MNWVIISLKNVSRAIPGPEMIHEDASSTSGKKAKWQEGKRLKKAQHNGEADNIAGKAIGQATDKTRGHAAGNEAFHAAAGRNNVRQHARQMKTWQIRQLSRLLVSQSVTETVMPPQIIQFFTFLEVFGTV